ncbi:TRAP transporter solute receptor [Vibrio ponticus]|nr:TRAP transporter solute receptor [Vibrio ponticus]
MILETAFRVAAFDMYTQAIDANANSWATMSQEYPDIQVLEFPPEVRERLNSEKQALLEEYASKDPLAQRIIESQRQYLSKVRSWTEISTKAYLNSN